MRGTNLHAAHSGVMRGLDSRIHDETQRAKLSRLCLVHGLVDGRVKPGHDGEEALRTSPSGVAA
ncbi:MAG TPA: hypothetical protein VI137_08945 [Pseudolabrys sp.]